jgi:hypothetical protein
MIPSRSIHFIISFIFLFILVANAQKPKDKSEFDIYQYKPTPRDRIILEVNHTGWLNMPHGLRETATSGGVNFQLFFDKPIGYSRFSFAWGAGISSHNIHGKINLVALSDTSTGNTNFTAIEIREKPYRINRIGFKILEVPVEFRFRTRTNYQFKVMAGFKVGYVVQTFRKIFDKDGKAKLYDIYGANPWRYGLVLRVGWEQVHISMFYALSEVFEQGKGQKGIIPFSIGIAYTPRLSLGSGSNPVE